LEAKLRWAEELERIVVKRVLPGSRLILVGSSTNMFGFKHSDCDLTVVTKDRFVSEMECLRKIESALKPHRSRFDVEVRSLSIHPLCTSLSFYLSISINQYIFIYVSPYLYKFLYWYSYISICLTLISHLIASQRSTFAFTFRK
jgi:hypothetical protein